MGLLDDARPCAGCRGDRGPICPTCRPAFRRPAFLVRRDDLALPVVASAGYEGPVREALVAFKDHGRWSLRGPLGASLARSVDVLQRGRLRQLVELAGRSLPPDPDVPDLRAYEPVPGAARFLLVTVPSTASSVRSRDGDHVLELARRVAERSRQAWSEATPGLVVVRRRRDQVGLGRAARAANLHGSMRATDVLVRRAARPGTAVVLVDDIVTTGASLAEAHRALLAAGVRPWGAAVVAATPDRPLRGGGSRWLTVR